MLNLVGRNMFAMKHDGSWNINFCLPPLWKNPKLAPLSSEVRQIGKRGAFWRELGERTGRDMFCHIWSTNSWMILVTNKDQSAKLLSWYFGCWLIEFSWHGSKHAHRCWLFRNMFLVIGWCFCVSLVKKENNNPHNIILSNNPEYDNPHCCFSNKP